MVARMTWAEIAAKYPDQWVSLIDVSLEENGDVKSGIVEATGPDLKTVIKKNRNVRSSSHQFKYTGAVKNFLGFAKWDLENAAAH